IYANDHFVASNNGISLGLLFSTDGATWVTNKVAGAGGSVQGLAGGGGAYVVTTGGFGSTPKIFTSTDTTTWTETTPADFTVAPNWLAYANTRFVLVAGTNAWVRPDGMTWTSHPIPSDLALTSVQARAGRFVARNYPYFASSEDGVTWA